MRYKVSSLHHEEENALLFSAQRPSRRLSLFLNNARIEFLRSIKILGVTLDKDLSYKEHISDPTRESLREGLCTEKNKAFSSS